MAAEPMRILFTRFPLESAHGGAEVQTLSLMEGLRARGHTVSFLGSCPVLLRWAQEAGFAVQTLEIGPPPVSARLALTFAWHKGAMRGALHKAFDALRPDAVCMLSLTEKLLLTQRAAAAGTRTLWIEHDRVGRWLTLNPWRPLLLRAARSATTVAVSDASAAIHARLGWPRDRLTAIPDGIDQARIGPARTTWKTDGRLRVGCIARLTHDKGVDVLIEAVSMLPDVTLTIVGTGRDRSEIERAIARSGAADRIDLWETVQHIGDFQRRIDILALPSRSHDPFGMVAAESLFVGTPVIVTEACGIGGYLHHGIDAMVVPAGDPGALSEAMTQLFPEERRRALGTAGRLTAERLFSLDAMVERYENLLRS